MTISRAVFGWTFLGALAGSIAGSIIAASIGQPAGAGFFWAVIHLPVEVAVAIVTATVTGVAYWASARYVPESPVLPAAATILVGIVLYFVVTLVPAIALLVWPLGYIVSLLASIAAHTAAIRRQQRRQPRQPPGYSEPLDP